MITEPDTSALNAIVQKERRRTALRGLETAAFIDADTVQRLRRDVFADGVIERTDAEMLFLVEGRGITTCPEWRDFFIETALEHLLWQKRPTGVLTEDKAQWLIAQADRTRTMAAFAILVMVLEEADRTPAWFAPAVRERAERGWPGLDAVFAA